jgi:hypothetical protein
MSPPLSPESRSQESPRYLRRSRTATATGMPSMSQREQRVSFATLDRTCDGRGLRHLQWRGRQLSSVAALPQSYVWTAGLGIPTTWNSLIEQECG